MIDFDVELAMVTGQPVRMRSAGCVSADSLHCRPLDHTLSFGDGQREGWISRNQEDADDRDAEFIMKMVESSRIRAEEGSKESWCPVWDGPRDPLARGRSWQRRIP